MLLRTASLVHSYRKSGLPALDQHVRLHQVNNYFRRKWKDIFVAYLRVDLLSRHAWREWRRPRKFTVTTVDVPNATGTENFPNTVSLSQSHITTVGRSVSLSSGAHDQILVTAWHLLSCPLGAPSLKRGRVCRLSQSVRSITSIVSMYNNLHITCYTWHYCIYNIYMTSVSLGSVQQIMPYFLAFATSAVIDTWTVVCLTAA
jgi:hypothetical protein